MGLWTRNCTVVLFKKSINRSMFYIRQFVWWTEHDSMIDCANVKTKWKW